MSMDPVTSTNNADVAPLAIDDSDLFGATVVIEDKVFGPSYPTLQWVNGKATAKPKKGGEADIDYTGGWFLSAEHGIVLPGSHPFTLITRDGEEVEGHAVRDLTFTPISYRRCFEVTPQGAKFSTRYAVSEYDEAKDGGAAKGKMHLLVQVEGLEDLLVVSATGFVSSRFTAQTAKNRGIIPSYGQAICNRASQLAKKQGKNIQYPMCAFKLTVGPEHETDGTPKFTEVGANDKSFITYPVWIDEPNPALVDDAYLKRLYVGNGRFAKLQQSFTEATEWREAWSAENLAKLAGRAEKPAGSTGTTTAGAAPSGKDMPF